MGPVQGRGLIVLRFPEYTSLPVRPPQASRSRAAQSMGALLSPVCGILVLPVLFVPVAAMVSCHFVAADCTASFTAARCGGCRRLCNRPVAVGVSGRIGLFTAGAFMPVIGAVGLPIRAVGVGMIQRGDFCRFVIAANSACTLLFALFRFCGLLCHRPVAVCIGPPAEFPPVL